MTTIALIGLLTLLVLQPLADRLDQQRTRRPYR